MVAGANVHDTKLLEATLAAIVVERPQPTDPAPQHLCLDKGYDNPTGHQAAAAHGYQAHIRRIGEEKLDSFGEKTHPARRWVLNPVVAVQVQRITCPLRQKGIQFPGSFATGLRATVVPASLAPYCFEIVTKWLGKYNVEIASSSAEQSYSPPEVEQCAARP